MTSTQGESVVTVGQRLGGFRFALPTLSMKGFPQSTLGIEHNNTIRGIPTALTFSMVPGAQRCGLHGGNADVLSLSRSASSHRCEDGLEARAVQLSIRAGVYTS